MTGLGSGRLKSQITLFLAWGSFSWVGEWCHPAHAMLRPSCPTFAMLLLEPTGVFLFQVWQKPIVCP